jgi:hypothetical protein
MGNWLEAGSRQAKAGIREPVFRPASKDRSAGLKTGGPGEKPKRRTESPFRAA